MFENQTDKNIKERMLNNVPSNVCKLEGSFIYDALSPVSLELSAAYMALDTLLNNIFMRNAEGEYLEKRAEEYAVYRKEGTKAAGKAKFLGDDGPYNKGILISTATGCLYKTKDELVIADGEGTVEIEAAETGSKYNMPLNSINGFPAAVKGLNSVTNIEATVGGTDLESDADLLKRLLTKIQCPSTSGNINHYKQWALEVNGVGDIKVITPSFTAETSGDGAALQSNPSDLKKGDVKLIIISTDKKPVSSDIVTDVFDHVEKQRPIGVRVIVESAVPKGMNISGKIDLQPGYKLDDIKATYIELLEKFRKEVTFNQNEISYAKIGSLLISIPGVKDYDALTLNGESKNIKLKENEVINSITLNLIPTSN